jgi:hypothetical protein
VRLLPTGKAICDSNQAFFSVACRIEDVWIGGFSLNYLWIYERNLSPAVYLLNDHAAWQKQARHGSDLSTL